MTHSTPYSIGLIGGIACGKSTALAFFKQHGIETFSADSIAKQLLAPHTKFYHAIKQRLGEQSLRADGQLNRDFLRHLLIQEPDFKQWLEHLLHPEIKKQLIQDLNQSQSSYCVLEIPLLIDKKSYPLNKILSIESSTEVQKARLALRQLSPNDIDGLLNIQTPKPTRLKIADDVIENNGSLNDFVKKLEQMHEHYLKTAKAQKTSL